jgi:hypothetical protein
MILVEVGGCAVEIEHRQEERGGRVSYWTWINSLL